MGMNGDHDETANEATQQTDQESTAEPTTPAQRARTSDDFLVPGPSPESNAGLRQWGCTWLAFSLILMLLMLGLSFVCLMLANWTGFA
jgi:hypothetical protein